MKRQILLGVLILLFIQTLAVAGDTYYVPSRDYPTIQIAINAAAFANDDVVVVAPGVYTGAGNINLDFGGRAITVRSEINPNNPNPNPAIIAATIIDCGGEPAHNPLSDNGDWNRAFRFHSGEDPNSKVLGFTIRNGYARGPKGADGEPGYIGYVDASNPIWLFVPIPPCAVDDPNNCPPYALDGKNSPSGPDDGYGGAILCDSASSPTIQYCVISNCTVTGAHGGDGADGLDGIWEHWTLGDIDPCAVPPKTDDVNNTITENPDGQWGGSGGWGSGNGYGGAIACRGLGTNPIISDCIISDNFARGGCGGDGGDGGNAYAEPPDPEYDDGLEGGGGDAGVSIGDGIGGAIYCDGASSPVITNCTFSNNIAMTGIRGTGGQRGLGNEDDPRAFLGSDGLVFSTGGIAGGAAYYNTNSDPNFTNCTFTSNKAYEAYVFYDPSFGEDISAYTVGGALYSVANNTVTLDSCKFIGNLGGAVYCRTGCNLDFDDCLFSDNSEIANGGALYIDTGCTVDLQGCIFGGNSAYDDGGALKCKSDITLTNCSFGNNIAYGQKDFTGYGGAMDAYRPSVTLIIDVNACSFAGNQSIYGGGFSSENFDANFTDCYFIGNTAQGGGGLDLVNGNISVTSGVVKGNDATDGDGGGFNCRYTIAEIRDCTISDNFADGVYPAGGSGGAINFDGGAPTQVVFNCLLTGNFATINGGAIFCRNATPEIGNCTFSGNFAGDYGGAIFSDWASDPQITDAIFQNNNSHAIHEEDSGGDALVKYSLFFNNPDGDYYDSGTGMTYSGSGQVGSIPGGIFNLYGGPLFESGPLGGFYLRQQPVQPLPQSPAVDTGSTDANDPNIGLDTYTTRTDSANDVNLVDRGYHYFDVCDVDTFQLTASVIGGQGTVAPTAPPPVDYNAVTDTYTYYAGMVVTLTAEPDAGWRVKAWSGTEDDSSTATTNSVVMNSHRDVTVEFEQPRTLIVAVGGGDPGYYSNIQDAVSDAEDGDTIVVYPGIYYGGYFGVMIYVDKSITIRSIHPDDPCYVAATIIDGYNEYQFNEGYNNLGITFGPHTNADTILNGFTIQNCGGYWGDGLDGDRGAPFFHPDGYDGGMGAGAAIRVSSGGGPVIKNCVIRDNLVIGGDGGDAVGADATHNAGRGGWGGYAWGGAIYCDANSSPTFINCQIIDNYAQGGSGGDGGDDVIPGGFANYGGNWSIDGTPEYPVLDIDPYSLDITTIIDGGLWEVWGYVGDYRWYSGYGGGVFINTGSTVTFTHCTISGNLAQGGVSGQGGEQLPGLRPLEPLIPYEIPSFGGGVYCAADSTVTFTGCTITNNTASEPNENNSHLDPYLGHGGGVCAEDTAALIFTDCTFSENQAAVGGGIHFANANLEVSDCNFTSNSAFQGGGLFGEHGPATILRSNFTNNEAVSDPNDPNVVILGEGGGLHFWATEADIIDCNISSNQAEASGGGVFFGGEGTSFLANCLLTKNTAGRDGGGVSANIFTQLTVSNCTIADNAVTGVGFPSAFGGGLYVSYESDVNVIDSIIWSNFAIKGPQVGIGITASPSTVKVSYSDIGPRAGLIDFEAGEPFWADWNQSDGATLIDAQTIYDQFGVDGWAEVIVSLFEPVELRKTTDWTSPESVAVLREEIDERQDPVLSTLTPAEFTLRHRFENQTGFSGEVTINGLNKLLSNSLVAYIEPVRYAQIAMAQAIQLTNALEARQLYDGTGIAVAIIDTGVDYTHPRLGNDGFPNNKVIGGYDFADGDPDPIPGDIVADTAHGTCCAGIATGDLGTVGDYIGGVAPSAKICALKATSDDDPFQGFRDDDTLAAWDWCVTHRNDDPNNPIKVMSNSWVIYGLPFDDPAEADALFPAHAVAVDTANAAGIAVLAASGNDGFAGQGISWPSAMSKVISVGAVYDTTDMVTEYSNTADNLDILAPADPIYTTDIVGVNGYDLGDYFPNFGGTSAACPFAAGAVASIQSAAMAEWGHYLNPEQVRTVLVVSGVPVTDTKVNITKPRVNLAAAISYLVTPSIYVDNGCTFIGWDPNAVNVGDWDPNFSSYHNIDEDPNFVAGYYLSQIAAGQLVDSSCVDAGSADANDPNIALHTYTTRTDSFPDTYDLNNPDPNNVIVDMGYHYPLFEVPQYELTVTAIEVNELPEEQQPVVEPNAGFYNWYTTVTLTVTTPVPEGYQVLWSGADDDGLTGTTNTVTMDSDRVVTVTFVKSAYDLTVEVIGSGGSVSPIGTNTYPRGTVVDLTAYPEEGYRLKQWTGTDNDTSTATTNTVTMFSDRIVTVEFELPATITVPGDYPTIQEAIVAARDGDKIIIATGVYTPSRVGFVIDKEIMLTSTNPDDPNIVALTVIDPTDRAFWFTSNAGPNTVLNGITIANGGVGVLPADDGDDDHPDGYDGGGTGGGAMYCSSGSSPTIKNCVITNFQATGGDAGSAIDANEARPGGHGGWAGWARGGGVYIASNSSPTFINCTISNCTATGGNAGDGGDGAEGEDPDWWQPPGNGGNWSDGILWQYWGYVGDYRYYSGYGGGVFCAQNSSPTFIACTITGNSTQGGMSGVGGVTPDDVITDPYQSYEIPSYGGGVYCGAGSTVVFRGCTITNNVAPKPSIDEVTAEVIYHLDPYLGHGGGIAFEETASVIFEEYVSPITGEVRNCVISENVASVGGGMYWANAAPEISDCNVSDNLAYQGGGLFGASGSAIIENCIIQSNFAGTAPNDVDDVAGQGGGIYSASMVAEIIDCNISDNEAGASGGGIFFTGVADSPIVINCLVTDNEAGRDGGGFSINWYSEPIIANCTVVGNQATGNFGEIGNTGFGGGLYSSYHSNSEVIDSIFWNNSAIEGYEIAVGTGFEFDPRPATLTVSYSDVQSGQSHAYVEDDCNLIWDPNNLYADPLFVIGPLGDYYLSQTEVGDPCQTVDSLCVDAGSDSAIYVGMSGYTTRTDELFDRGIVDMGYHHLITLEVEECRVVDLFLDHFINFKDFAVFAWNWLMDDCSDDNGWCDGADLTFDGNVDWEDLEFYIGCWLVVDNDIPVPNPSEWAVEPYSSSPTSISMVAKTAVDSWGGDVGYYFECVYGDCNDSGWQSDPCYTDDAKGFGLDPNTEYGYRVRAKDSRCGDISDLNCTFDPNDPNDPNAPNKTDWSDIRYAITGEEAPDTDPPEPDPLTWSVAPYATSSASISMTATTATDESGVEYYFECITDDINSGWQDSPAWEDTGLAPSTTYTYRVQARDMSPLYNETGWSTQADATTPIEDTEPPVPDPMTWATAPYATSPTSVSMVATTATDVSGVEYYFECTSHGQYSSGWQDSPIYSVTVAQGALYTFVVRARDKSPNRNTTGDSAEIAADPDPPTPDPMTWEVAPHATSSTTIAMTATTATDESGVEYYFECITDGTNSGWQDSPTWEDTGLAPSTTYTYRVQARDKSPSQNPTGWSSSLDATTALALQAPIIVGANQVEVGSYWHHIITARATDVDPLYFRFVCLNASTFNSAWVPRVGPAVETFAHPVQPLVWPDATITRGSDVITYDIAVSLSWNLWQWQVCGSNEEDYDPSLCSAPVEMPSPF